MSANVIKVNGDYKIKSVQGGNITLDAGSTGNVKITGHLTVEGSTTSVTTTNTDITDNIITLNKGESTSQISANSGQAGIEIDRGRNNINGGNAHLYFIEGIEWSDPVEDIVKKGLFVFKTENQGICGIRTVSINTDGKDLYLINNGNGVISVTGTSNYETHVLDDDHIPNKKYVDDKVGSGIRLTIASNKTLTVNNTLTLTGTDGSSVAFGSGGTVAYKGTGLAQFASTSSSDLRNVISDETGTGALVFNNSPTITGHPTIEGVTSTGSTGTGLLVFNNSPVIAGHPTIEGKLLTGATGSGLLVLGTSPTITTPVITGNLTIQGVTTTGATGTGKIVFDTSPTLATPTLGVATATTINKVTITAPAASATLTIANTKTLTISNTLTFTGTDASSVNFRNGGTVTYLGSQINSQISGYVLDLTDQNKTIYTSADITIPDNGSVGFPIGTIVDIIAKEIIYIGIDLDTLQWGGQSSDLTGTRIIAKYGMARLIKVTANIWYISGQGIT